MRDVFERTRPKTTKNIIGNASVIQSMKTEIRTTSKGILVSGPTGIGKTLAAELIIKELDAEGIWLDASELDSKTIDKLDVQGENIFSLMQNTKSKVKTTSLRKKVFIIDNADSFPETVNKHLIKKFEVTIHTIVIICNDPYPLKSLEKYCICIKFIRPSKIQIKNFLLEKGIFKESPNQAINQKIHTKIEDLVTETNNDIRFLLNTLNLKQTKSGKDKTVNNIFDAASIMFDSDESDERKINAFYSDTFIIPQIIHENYAQRQKRPMIEYSKTADDLAEADIFAHASGPGHFELSNYQGYSLIQGTKRHRINFPTYPKSMGKDSSIRSMNTQLTEMKLGGNITSRVDVIPYLLPILIQKITSREFESAREIMNKYSITRDILYDVLSKFWLGPDCDIKVPTKEKSAFTRYLNNPVKPTKPAKPATKIKEKIIAMDNDSSSSHGSKTSTEYALVTEFQKLNIREFFTSF